MKVNGEKRDRRSKWDRFAKHGKGSSFYKNLVRLPLNLSVEKKFKITVVLEEDFSVSPKGINEER